MNRKFQDSPNTEWFKVKDRKDKNYKNVIKTFMGRDAINLLLYNIDTKDKRVLLPAYTCSEVTDSFRAYGIDIIFYDQDNFKIETLELNSIDIFYFIRYFGIEPEGIQNVIDRVKEKNPNSLIVEDRAHYLSDKKLLDGIDAYIFSFRKLLPIPEGGGLMTDMDINYRYKNIHISNILALAMVFKKRFLGANPKFSRSSVSIKSLKTNHTNYVLKPSFFTNRVIENFDIDKNIAIRRELFYLWLKKVERADIKPLFKELKEDDIPQGFPIVVENAKELYKKMIEKKIYLKRHWELNIEFKDIAPKSYILSTKLITLPIYEGIDESDMDTIIDKIKSSI